MNCHEREEKKQSSRSCCDLAGGLGTSSMCVMRTKETIRDQSGPSVETVEKSAICNEISSSKRAPGPCPPDRSNLEVSIKENLVYVRDPTMRVASHRM